MIRIRSPSLSASCRSWVMKIIVLPTSSWSRITSFCMSRRISGSSAENGSSNIISAGSTARARARPTRCCMPPESWSGNDSSLPDRPTRSTISCALVRRSSLATPRTSSPNATLSITVRCGSRPKCWKTIATWLRRSSRSWFSSASVTFSPPMMMVPAVGSMSRVSSRTSVDLPDPESPITTKTSPGFTSKDTSFTAATQPVLACSSLRGRSASGVPMILSALGPKIFQSPVDRQGGVAVRGRLRGSCLCVGHLRLLD